MVIKGILAATFSFVFFATTIAQTTYVPKALSIPSNGFTTDLIDFEVKEQTWFDLVDEVPIAIMRAQFPELKLTFEKCDGKQIVIPTTQVSLWKWKERIIGFQFKGIVPEGPLPPPFVDPKTGQILIPARIGCLDDYDFLYLDELNNGVFTLHCGKPDAPTLPQWLRTAGAISVK